MAKQSEAQARQTYWQNHIEQWKRSGLSQIQYCRRHKINKNTLGYWIKKRTKQPAPVALGQGFVQLPVKVTDSTPIEIRINNRYKILVTGGFDAELLKDTIKTLEQIS
jgi:hypothetical protein